VPRRFQKETESPPQEAKGNLEFRTYAKEVGPVARTGGVKKRKKRPQRADKGGKRIKKATESRTNAQTNMAQVESGNNSRVQHTYRKQRSPNAQPGRRGEERTGCEQQRKITTASL